MAVSFSELLEAFEFVNFGGTGEHQAFLCRQTGKLYWHSEFPDEFDELPEDIDDSEKYIQIPDKRELGLGKPLALDFARQFLPEHVDQVRAIFPGEGLTRASRTCWNEGVFSTNGMISRRKRRSKLCATGATFIQ